MMKGARAGARIAVPEIRRLERQARRDLCKYLKANASRSVPSRGSDVVLFLTMSVATRQRSCGCSHGIRVAAEPRSEMHRIDATA